MLEKALLALGENEMTVLARSRQWRSRAWPDPDAPDYRNAVCLVETKLTPASLMATLHRIERAFGRVRDVANAPRTLDLDLIAYGRVVQSGEPVLPHPRAADRRFVMGPLAELLPAWRHPLTGETAAALAETAGVGQDAIPIVQG
ncbi:MAG: 2-amino-4-hydroxy-6-hydroxymethyldihydropteridine diphosphokinase [Pseudomonadota bacterium]|nr:2-amino-4-hydroxy-6-hydroxymethyldihydropteridine diphosphokinase [Pseudomonadota bacterium]